MLEKINIKEYQTVMLGALLHDIGKYLHRGKVGNWGKGKHPKVGANFVEAWKNRFARCVDADLLVTLVQRHHENPKFPEELQLNGIEDDHTRTLARLVSQADHMASSERAEKSDHYQNYRTTALTNPFYKVQLLEENHRPLTSLGVTEIGIVDQEPPIFPVDESRNKPELVTEYIHCFSEAFEKSVEGMCWDDFQTVYSHLMGLLNRYMSVVPSDTQTDPPDVSLYDHLRMTSAIAGCLYQYHVSLNSLNEKDIKSFKGERCLLLAGDISGIQKFLFDISSIGSGGVAKRLRARSFFLQMLSEVASLKIVQEFHLPTSNIFMSSGGNFFILLPRLEDAAQKISNLQKQCDQWFLEKYHGLLDLNIAWVTLSDQEFGKGIKGHHFSLALKRVRLEMTSRKQRPLEKVLVHEGKWDTDVFVREPFPNDANICSVCHRFPAKHKSQPDTERNDLCDICERDVQLGRDLVRSKYIGVYHKPMNNVIRCFDWSFEVSSSLARLPEKPAFLIKINDSDLSDVKKYPANFRFFANYIKSDSDGTVWTFEEIASQQKLVNQETASGLLAVIKADADHLGEVFKEGLARDKLPHYDTPSRIASMSRTLDLFFSGWMNWFLKHEFPLSYTVYSGGDDLLIIVPQKDALRLIKRLRDAYQKLTCNPEMTFSAGIVVVRRRLPLAHTVEFAERALKKAKKKRNQLCILDSLIDWEDLPIIEESVNLISQIEKNEPPSAFLYQLIYFSKLWREWKVTGKTEALRFQPLLAYSISRNLNAGTDLFDWASKLVGFQINDLTLKEARIMDYLGVIAKWVILRRREK